MTRKKSNKASTKRSPRTNTANVSSRPVSSARRSSASTAGMANFGEGRDFKDIIRDIASNPAVKYVAGGIATAMLTKLASSLSGRYPEISRLLNENLENFEDKLREFRGSSSDQMDTQH